MGAPLEFRLLGPVEAIADSGPLSLGGPKQRALLALLLLRANEVVPRERLIDELWGDAPPPAARDTVKVYVGRLRKLLTQNGSPEHLVTRGGGYLLQIQPEQLDLHRFESLAATGSRSLADGDAKTAAAVLGEALSLWRGPALVDLGEVPFVAAEQARLEEQRLSALEDRIEADLALGQTSSVVPELQQLTREHPYRERFHRQRMLALYRDDRQAEALAAYQEARTALVDQLGLEPSTQLRDLEKAILAHDPALERPQIETDTPEPRAAPDAMPSGPARRRLRVLLLTAAAVVVVAATAGALLHDGAEATVAVRPNSVAVIDPDSNKIVADIQVGRQPEYIAVTPRRVWVTNRVDRTVMGIDPRSRTIKSTIPVKGPPAGFAASSNAFWVITLGNRLELTRFDTRFERATKSVLLSNESYFVGTHPLAFGASTIWSYDDVVRALVQRDATTLEPRGTVLADADGPWSIAAATDATWVTTSDNRLLRIDPATNRVVEDIRTPNRPVDVAVGDSAIWVATDSENALTRYDPVTRSIQAVELGDTASRARAEVGASITYGFGSIWVASHWDGSVWRIDPDSRRVVGHWKLDVSPGGIAAGEGAVWVTAYSELPP